MVFCDMGADLALTVVTGTRDAGRLTRDAFARLACGLAVGWAPPTKSNRPKIP